MNMLFLDGSAFVGGVSGYLLDHMAARVKPKKAAPPADDAATEETPPLRPAPGPPRFAERYGMTLLGAVLFVAAADRIGTHFELVPYAVLFSGLLAVSVADVRVGLVPRRFVYPTLAVMVTGLVITSIVNDRPGALVRAGVGGVGAFFFFGVIWWVSPRSMGFGDVRLAGLIGTGLGWIGYRELYLGFMVGVVAGALFGILKMAILRTGRKTALPFGPSLALGAVIGVLWGTTLARYWINHLH